VVLYNNRFNTLHMAIPWFLMTTSIVLLVVVCWTYKISNRLVGPYERVLREIDGVLEGKGKKIIVARKGDMLFEELLKRVNELINRMPE